MEQRIDEIRGLIGNERVAKSKAIVEGHWERRLPTIWRILREGTDEERELVRYLARQHPERLIVMTGRIVVEAQRKEALALQEKNRRKQSDAENENGTKNANSFIPLACERGDSNPHGVSH